MRHRKALPRSARRLRCRGRMAGPGFCGRSGAGRSPPGPGSGRCGRTQSVDGGPAGYRQEHAGQAAAGDLAAHELRRSFRDHRHLLGSGAGALRAGTSEGAAVPQPPPQRQRHRHCGRRKQRTPRRGQPGPQRGSVSGRAAGVFPGHAGSAAPAVGGRAHHGEPGPCQRHLPLPVHAGGSYEPLQVRVPRLPRPRMYLHPQRH